MLKSNLISKYATSSHAPVYISLVKLLLSGAKVLPPLIHTGMCDVLLLHQYRLYIRMRILHIVNQL